MPQARGGQDQEGHPHAQPVAAVAEADSVTGARLVFPARTICCRGYSTSRATAADAERPQAARHAGAVARRVPAAAQGRDARSAPGAERGRDGEWCGACARRGPNAGCGPLRHHGRTRGVVLRVGVLAIEAGRGRPRHRLRAEGAAAPIRVGLDRGLARGGTRRRRLRRTRAPAAASRAGSWAVRNWGRRGARDCRIFHRAGRDDSDCRGDSDFRERRDDSVHCQAGPGDSDRRDCRAGSDYGNAGRFGPLPGWPGRFGPPGFPGRLGLLDSRGDWVRPAGYSADASPADCRPDAPADTAGAAAAWTDSAASNYYY